MQVEVHITEATQDPVMSRVLEDVRERHRVVGESVHKESLELTLAVVKQQHEDT